MTPISQPSRPIRKVVGNPTTLPLCCKVVKDLAVEFGVKCQVFHADLLQESLGPLEPRRVYVHRDDREIPVSRRALEAIQSRHFFTARHTPGRPEI